MIKYLFSFIALLFISSPVNSQKIDYTNNKLYKLPSNRYNIVGEINGNFVVWKTDLNKHLLSQLFIYDSEMKLIRTIYTNILSSDADPNYQFFITANSILIAYQYKTNDALLYRLANFDENGGLKSVETLDSINVNDKNISNKTLFYKFCNLKIARLFVLQK